MSTSAHHDGESIDSCPDRRTALQMTCLGLVAMPLVVACGSTEVKPSPTVSKSTGQPIAKTTDIPEGSAKIIPAEGLVITNDPAGSFQAFSYLCTHQGCPVTSVDGEQIKCSCHGSAFSTVDGSVIQGPATKPLAQIDLRVEGDNIFRA